MTVRTDNCATGFSEIFAEKSFLYKNIIRTGWLDRPDGRTSAASNCHNRLRASGRLNFSTQFPYLIRVRPDHKGETSGWLKSNRQLPYTMHQRPDQSDVRTVHFELRFLPYGDTCPDGIPHRPDG
jgi:hypothetical protein